MNAQEAIENEQIELDELKSELKRREFLVHAVNDDGLLNARTFQIEQVKMIKKMIEQKSIVLESAKVFHEAFENGNISSLSSGGNVLVIGATMDVDLTKAEAEKIGIEVEE